MILLVPLSPVILIVWVIVKCWRVTVPLLTVAGLYLMVRYAPAVGWSVIGFIAVIAFFVLRSQIQDRRVGRIREDWNASHLS